VSDHIWIEMTDLSSLPDRVWMCNVHPGEEVRRKQWEPEPTTTDEIARLRELLSRLEWAGNVVGTRCPVCRAIPYPERGLAHYPGCELAEALGRG
jgi:hypothetical protein